MDECPVCLEPLLGTVVHLGCCKKQVHIQCYVTKCPMCRAELPSPPLSERHVIVPVPVFPPPQMQQTRSQKLLSIGMFFITIGITAALVLHPY
jgi:hypothetical protein